MSKIGMAGLVIVSLVCFTLTSFSEQAVAQTDTISNRLPYADAGKIRGIVDTLLPRSGRSGIKTGDIKDMGAVYAVKVVDTQKTAMIRNELFVRKDGAVMPAYGARVIGNGLKLKVDHEDKARGLAAIWLLSTSQSGMAVGVAQETALAYVVTIHKKDKPKEIANQLIIRKDGMILPVGTGKTLYPGKKSTRALDSGFGWDPSTMLPFFDDELPSGGWWGNDWDTGWWGSGWGWGWGSGDGWTAPGDDVLPCDPAMDTKMCTCYRQAHNICLNKPDPNCFERNYDSCMNPPHIGK